MWPFSPKKYNLADSELMRGYTEWHCHLLPGVDDGVKTMEESLELLQTYEDAGVETVWLTPHVMEDIPNATDKLRERFAELKDAYKGSIDLHLASENMLDNLFDSRLEARDLLPIGEGQNHLLVETSFFTPPVDLWEKLERVRLAGYFPLLAHPERYIYMADKDYDRLRKMGVKFQLNLFSLFGMYGPDSKEKAQKMLKKGYYEVFGTDTHKHRQMKHALHTPSITRKEIEALQELEGIE